MPVLQRKWAVSISDILPKASQEGAFVGRDGWQDCKLHKTSGKSPKWFIKYAVDVTEMKDGKKLTRRTERREYFGYCKDVKRREAEERRDAFRLTVNTPRREVVNSQVLLKDWVAKYQKTFVPTLKPNTQDGYIYRTNQIAEVFGNVRLCDITREEVQGWINEMAANHSRGTCGYCLAVFSSLMNVASDWGYNEDRNPCKRVRIPFARKSKADLRALLPDEIRRLFAASDGVELYGVSMGGIIRVAIFCGLRIGEILALEWRDIHQGHISVNKSRSQRNGETAEPKSKAGHRDIPLGPVRLSRPADALDLDRVFPLEYMQARHAVRKLLKTAGIVLTGTSFHALRRTFCTYFEAAGATSLKEQMGHESDYTSQIYVRKSFLDAERAVNRMAEFILGPTGGAKQ